MSAIIYYCPTCHQRLFDANIRSAQGIIEIKCPRCRQIQTIRLYVPKETLSGTAQAANHRLRMNTST